MNAGPQQKVCSHNLVNQSCIFTTSKKFCPSFVKTAALVFVVVIMHVAWMGPVIVRAATKVTLTGSAD